MREEEWTVSDDPRAMWGCAAGWRAGGPGDRKQRLFAAALSRLLGPEPGEIDFGGWQAALANAEGMAAGRPTSRTPGRFWVDDPDTSRAVRSGLKSLHPRQLPAAAALVRDLLGDPWRRTPREPCTGCAGGYVPTTGRDDNCCPRCRGRGWHFPRRLLTPDVLALARAAGECRAEGGWLDPLRLSVLADALEDAGAVAVSPPGVPSHPEERLLRHLRGFQVCRGCMPPSPEEAECGSVYWCPGCGGTEGGNPDAYWRRAAGPHALGCWALDAVSDLWQGEVVRGQTDRA